MGGAVLHTQPWLRVPSSPCKLPTSTRTPVTRPLPSPGELVALSRVSPVFPAVAHTVPGRAHVQPNQDLAQVAPQDQREPAQVRCLLCSRCICTALACDGPWSPHQ